MARLQRARASLVSCQAEQTLNDPSQRRAAELPVFSLLFRLRFQNVQEKCGSGEPAENSPCISPCCPCFCRKMTRRVGWRSRRNGPAPTLEISKAPPLDYVTKWRMWVEVAQPVGYESDAAFGSRRCAGESCGWVSTVRDKIPC